MDLLFTIGLAVTLISSIALSNLILDAYAQESPTTMLGSKQVFKVDVQVTNNEATDEIGTINVSIDGTDISKVLNGIICPAKSTVSNVFEFNSSNIPIGKGFTVDVVYGDDIFKKAYGVNNPSNTPEVVQISIP
jgi:hypothetical protein